MRINWKLRLQNKATLTTLAVAIVTAVYGVLAALGVTPCVTEEQAQSLVFTVIGILAALGIVTDPTTDGLSDSERAMGYEAPAKDGE